jgi:uncharacterized protein with HEPN domain
MPPERRTRREELLIVDMIERTRAIADAIRGRSRADLDADGLLADAILWSMVVMGEAASRLPSEFVARHEELPWRQVTGFRNLVVHTYERIDHDIVWKTVTEDVPEFARQLMDLVRSEYPLVGRSLDERWENG